MAEKIITFICFCFCVLQFTSATYNINFPYNVYMSLESNCGLVHGTDAENGKITSHLTYGKGIIDVPYTDTDDECFVTVDVSDYGSDARVSLRSNDDIELSPIGDYPHCDKLYIYDGQFNLTNRPLEEDIIANFSCSSVRAANISEILSTGTSITVYYHGHDDCHTGIGFQFLYSVFRVDSTCRSTEFQCDVDRCIPNSHVCDMVEHCHDNRDENQEIAGCTMPRLIHTILTWFSSLGLVSIIGLAVSFLIFLFLISSFIFCCHKSRKDERRVPLEYTDDDRRRLPYKRSSTNPDPGISGSDPDTGDEVTPMHRPIHGELRRRRKLCKSNIRPIDCHAEPPDDAEYPDAEISSDPEYHEAEASVDIESEHASSDLEEHGSICPDQNTQPRADSSASDLADPEALKLLFETLFQTAALCADKDERREVIMADVMFAMNKHSDKGTFN